MTITKLRKQINDFFIERDEDVLLMDGFDEAFIGYSQRINMNLCLLSTLGRKWLMFVSKETA